MRLQDVGRKHPVLKEAVRAVREHDGFSTLFPPQADALKIGFLDGKNLVLTIPTSSGKTLIGELAALKTVLEKRKKALYLVPLKALANEKYREFKSKYEKLGVRTAISIGDFDSSDAWLKDYDIIIASVEKADSLLRHEAQWFKDIGVVIADEVHLLDDSSRGPTLEVVLVRLLEISRPQVIALSATVNNAGEVASWLGAELVESDFRPVKVFEGVYRPFEIEYPSDRKVAVSEGLEGASAVVRHALDQHKQSIVFVASRPGAEAEADKMARIVSLREEEKRELKGLAEKIERVVSTPTRQCRRLASAVRKGAAFHHAGLVHGQKELVEDAFRDGLLKVVCATTTLAYGINLPCDYSVIRDVKRYYGGRGSDYIPVLEYKQCVGRAGRVRYSKEGRAVIISKNEREADEVMRKFVMGEPEEIYSKLSVEPVLRMHVLSLIATSHVRTEEDLEGFIRKTFYAFQYNDLGEIASKIENILRQLYAWKFIEYKGEAVSPTRLGKRVSELYLDPQTAHTFVRAISQPLAASEDEIQESAGFISGADILKKKKRVLTSFGLLQLISSSSEMYPMLRLKRDDAYKYGVLSEARSKQLLSDAPTDWDWQRAEFLQSLKTAKMLESWSSESTEDQLMENYNIAPGELRVKLNNADWLLYSICEFARLLGLKNVYREANKLRFRVKHGVKEELLKLVQLRGIGRVKARKLYQAGLKTPTNIRKKGVDDLAGLIGGKTAEKVLRELGA